jgi:hypothetical protein
VSRQETFPFPLTGETTMTAKVIRTQEGYAVVVERDFVAPGHVLAMFDQRYEHASGDDHIPAEDRDHAEAIAEAINNA